MAGRRQITARGPHVSYWLGDSFRHTLVPHHDSRKEQEPCPPRRRSPHWSYPHVATRFGLCRYTCPMSSQRHVLPRRSSRLVEVRCTTPSNPSPYSGATP